MAPGSHYATLRQSSVSLRSICCFVSSAEADKGEELIDIVGILRLKCSSALWQFISSALWQFLLSMFALKAISLESRTEREPLQHQRIQPLRTAKVTPQSCLRNPWS